MKKVKLLVVDDHPMLRGGIVSLLEKTPHIEVIGEASNGVEAIKFIEHQIPEVVLMDINMDGKLDVHTTELIVEKWPDVKVLAFSMHQEAQVIRRMLKAGAAGYLLKNASHQEMLKAIETVMNGENFYGPEVVRTMTQMLTSSDGDKQEVTLSNR
ncbi:MAG: response regulator, partial [Flavobacteriales bacterium]